MKIEDWMWEDYMKSEFQFLNEYDELAKKYGEEYRNIKNLLQLLKNAIKLKEQILED